MKRIEPITRREGLTEAQQVVYDSIASGPRGSVRGPFAVMLHNPAVAGPVDRLGAFLRYECSVPKRQRELAILVIGSYWRAEYEWFAHAPIAREQGHPEPVLAAIAAGEDPPLDDPLDQAVHDFIRELLHDKHVSDATFGRAEALLGKVGVLDLTALAGYYSLLAMVLNTFEVQAPDPAQVPWAQR